MKELQGTYRQIIQATSILGGVQIFQIAIAVVRSKWADKLYFVNELVCCVYSLVLIVLGYQLNELTGLGLAFLISYIL